MITFTQLILHSYYKLIFHELQKCFSYFPIHLKMRFEFNK